MNLKTLILLFLCCFIFSATNANDITSNQSNRIIPEVVESKRAQSESYRTWLSLDEIPNRLSFSTRTGFILLREEDIISIAVNPKGDGLILTYKKNGEAQKALCQSTLSQIMKRLNRFPFVRVSRKSIVNMNEIDQYEGTKRDANLILTDGSTIKVSRKMAGEVYNWIAHFKV